MTPRDPGNEAEARRKSRAVVMAIALAAFALLLFAITIAKLTVNQ